MQLQSNLEDYEKYNVNLLSYLTLDTEHLHSTVSCNTIVSKSSSNTLVLLQAVLKKA